MTTTEATPVFRTNNPLPPVGVPPTPVPPSKLPWMVTVLPAVWSMNSAPLFPPAGPVNVNPCVSIVIDLAGIGRIVALVAKLPVSLIVELASGLALAAVIASRSC
ncbi:hypothetical protein [Bosea sp. (in: a-proteobacteria)]|uniref:hypothetical protein n=1 Tax=Bosea sp. (in: a-proteobacteria) TaxID=1871050 RepID=UPI0031FE5779|nr:hypothetical protein [Bosea sp. (in: a-proteobacteria)]